MDLLVRALRRQTHAALADIASVVRAVAFWSGIALPFVHVPILALFGLTPRTTPVLVALWTLHALGLAVGARYDPDGRAPIGPGSTG